MEDLFAEFATCDSSELLLDIVYFASEINDIDDSPGSLSTHVFEDVLDPGLEDAGDAEGDRQKVRPRNPGVH